jgi:hypothetical protein
MGDTDKQCLSVDVDVSTDSFQLSVAPEKQGRFHIPCTGKILS